MNELNKKKQFSEYYQNQNKIFDMYNFLLDKEVLNDNGAIILITPNQMILTKNNPKDNGKPGSGNHYDTYDTLTKTLYDLPLDNRVFEPGSKELEYFVEMNYQIKNKQNILIRMINEGKSEKKMIAIIVTIPPSITSAQLEFLEYLEKQYGSLFAHISEILRNQGQDSLLLFQNKNRESIFCDSLKPLIEYLKINSINDNKELIKEKFLLGFTLDEIRQKNKQV